MRDSVLGTSVLVASFLVGACSNDSRGDQAGRSGTGGVGASVGGDTASAAGRSALAGMGGAGPGSGGVGPGSGGTALSTGGTSQAIGGAPQGGAGGTQPPPGGTSGTGGSDSTVPPKAGYITIHDPVPGWASVAGGTKGGGTDLGSAVTVTSMAELQSAVGGAEPKIVLVKPGTYMGELAPGPNKTVIGTAPGVIIHGNILISGEDKTNIIIRNIAVRQDRCGSYEACRSGSDAVYIGQGAHHIWLDHMDVADGQDGNCDVTRRGDYVTISWSKFHYTYIKAHAFSNLIAGSGGETESRGKLQITYMNCWWGDNVDQRQPMGRYGKIHMLNNFHKNNPTYIHEVNTELSLIAENCYYDVPGKPVFRGNHGPTGYKGIGNEGTAQGLNESSGTVFDIPYAYTPMSATEARDAVISPDCGAGNSCNLIQ